MYLYMCFNVCISDVVMFTSEHSHYIYAQQSLNYFEVLVLFYYLVSFQGEFKVTERALYMKEIVAALKEKRVLFLFFNFLMFVVPND